MSDESLAAMEIPKAHEGPAPLAQAQRISSLDALRGAAVMGILLMNIVGFGLPARSWEAGISCCARGRPVLGGLQLAA